MCRRDYRLIYHNIRSETEYDTLPVEPRTRQNDSENIFPLGALIELDRAFELAFNLPPSISPNLLSNANQPNASLGSRSLQNLLLTQPTENVENSITVSITNYNPPDENGRRIVQRTLFIADPSLLSSIIPSEMNSFIESANTPNTSLEPTSHLPFYNPLIPESNLMQEPSVIFNPNHSEPYRSLNNNNSLLQSNPIFNDPLFNNRNSVFEQSRTESLFERIFRDLTQQMASPNSTRSTTPNQTIPTNSDNLQTTTADNNEGTDNVSFDITENTPLRSGFIVRRRRGARRARANSRRRTAERPIERTIERNATRNSRPSRSEENRSRGSRTNQPNLNRASSRGRNNSKTNDKNNKGSG